MPSPVQHWPASRAEFDEQGRPVRIPNVLATDGRYDVHVWRGTLDEAFPMSAEPITLDGRSLREVAERVYSERRFDAWADRVDAELREAFGVGDGGDG